MCLFTILVDRTMSPFILPPLNRSNTKTALTKLNGILKKEKWISIQFPQTERYSIGIWLRTAWRAKRFTDWIYIKEKIRKQNKLHQKGFIKTAFVLISIMRKSSKWLWEPKRGTFIFVLMLIKENILEHLTRTLWLFINYNTILLILTTLYPHRRIGALKSGTLKTNKSWWVLKWEFLWWIFNGLPSCPQCFLLCLWRNHMCLILVKTNTDLFMRTSLWDQSVCLWM